MQESEIDVASFARAAAMANGLTPTEACWPGIEANLAVAFRLSRLFLDFELRDEAEPAPVFEAREESR